MSAKPQTGLIAQTASAAMLMLLLAAPAAGADGEAGVASPPAAGAMDAGNPPARPEVSDQDIADAIEDRWLGDGILDLNRITVTVDEGIAQIDGTATSLLEKQRATRIAEAVRGVRAVSNQLEVRPLSDGDDDLLQTRIETGLTFDPALGDGKVQVSVRDGIAHLTGTVASWPEKHSAERVAQDVRGVLAVDNALEVRYPDSRSDEEIRADVEERLRWDVRLSTVPLAVRVEDGVVVLSGQVASPAQRRWARWKSWVNGVEDVRVDEVLVSPWLSDDDWRPVREPVRDDAAIRDAVADALRYDPRVSRFDVTPSVEAGWVTLRGKVSALRAKQAAERVARHTVGVAGVTNRIKVRPDHAVDDDTLASRILAALTANPFTEANAFDAGVVTVINELSVE